MRHVEQLCFTYPVGIDQWAPQHVPMVQMVQWWSGLVLCYEDMPCSDHCLKGEF